MKFYDWKMDAIRDGRGFHVTIGALTTPILGGGAGTAVTLDEPEGLISVPDGTSILPIRVHVQCELPIVAGVGDVSEIIIGSDKDAAWDTNGTSAEETAINMRTTHTATSLCSCESAFTGAITASPALDYEIARAQSIYSNNYATTISTFLELKLLYEPLTPLILDGPCMLLVYWGGTGATWGFAQVEWLEFPSTYFT